MTTNNRRRRAAMLPSLLVYSELSYPILQAPIHLSAWKVDSENFALTTFSEVYSYGECIGPSTMAPCLGRKEIEELTMVFTLPADVDQRPVVIDGAGALGRRIASVYAAGGSDVRIFDLSAEQREAARDYVEEHLAQTQQTLGLHPARRGRVEVLGDLQ